MAAPEMLEVKQTAGGEAIMSVEFSADLDEVVKNIRDLENHIKQTKQASTQLADRAEELVSHAIQVAEKAPSIRRGIAEFIGRTFAYAGSAGTASILATLLTDENRTVSDAAGRALGYVATVEGFGNVLADLMLSGPASYDWSNVLGRASANVLSGTVSRLASILAEAPAGTLAVGVCQKLLQAAVAAIPTAHKEVAETAAKAAAPSVQASLLTLPSAAAPERLAMIIAAFSAAPAGAGPAAVALVEGVAAPLLTAAAEAKDFAGACAYLTMAAGVVRKQQVTSAPAAGLAAISLLSDLALAKGGGCDSIPAPPEFDFRDFASVGRLSGEAGVVAAVRAMVALSTAEPRRMHLGGVECALLVAHALGARHPAALRQVTGMVVHVKSEVDEQPSGDAAAAAADAVSAAATRLVERATAAAAEIEPLLARRPAAFRAEADGAFLVAALRCAKSVAALAATFTGKDRIEPMPLPRASWAFAVRKPAAPAPAAKPAAAAAAAAPGRGAGGATLAGQKRGPGGPPQRGGGGGGGRFGRGGRDGKRARY